MTVKNRPDAAKEALAQQAAGFRHGAPGKRFIGDAATQRARAKAAERQKVARMVEVDHAHHEESEIPVPLSAMLAQLVQDALHLVRTLASAPFRLALALRGRRGRGA